MARAAGLDQDERIDLGEIPPGRRLPAQPFLAFGVALLLVSCTIWANDVTSPALPDITDEFALSVAGAGLISSFLFIGRIIGNIPAARFLDRLGAPRLASIGALILIAGAITNGLAPTIEVFYVGRILQGIGIALLVNSGLRSIVNARPGHGSAMTIYGVASTIGSMIGLQSSGFITGAFGWRWVFALSAGLGVVLAILPVLNSQIARSTRRPVEPVTPVTANPVPLRAYLAPLAMNMVIFANYSTWSVLPLYAERKFGVAPETTANLLMVITITQLASALPVIRAIRRFGSARVLIGAAMLAMLGTVGLLFATAAWMLALPLVLYGMGMVGSVNSVGDIVLHRGGAGSSAVSSLRQTSDLGLVIGPVAAGILADAFGFAVPFTVFPLLMLVTTAGIILPGLRSSRLSKEMA